MMRKVILIGEFSLNIVMDNAGTPLGSMAGGRIAHAAAFLASQGIPSYMVGEASSDKVGQLATDFLTRAGVDTSCIDRFTEGLTPVMLHFPGDNVTRYEKYPAERFDVVWPRIDPGDIVVYGGFNAIDDSVRTRLLPLLQNAADHKATMIYVPGYLSSRAPRITKVMPAILENMEMASMIVTRTDDLKAIFNTTDPERAFAHNVSFYTPTMVNIDSSRETLTALSAGAAPENAAAPGCGSTLWTGGALGGIAKWAYANIAAGCPSVRLAPDMLRNLLEESVAAGNASIADSFPWQLSF